MEFNIKREELLEPLQLVVSVVEKKQALPLLSHVRLQAAGGLWITGSNLEVELKAERLQLEVLQEGETTVSARKLLDICRLLPENSLIHFKLTGAKLALKSAQGSYSLATLPADEYPSIASSDILLEKQVDPVKFLILLKKTFFSMAQNDVRYFLNGLCLTFSNSSLTAITTNGHRLASSSITLENEAEAGSQSLVIPRKAILELIRLLEQPIENAQLSISENALKVTAGCYQFISKLIEGRFPSYKKILETEQSKKAYVDKKAFQACLIRVAVLSDEKHRSVFCQFESNTLTVFSDNTQQERAEESIEVDYSAEDITLCLNIDYLLDVLNVLEGETVCITMIDMENSVLFEDPADDVSTYVIMPMKL